MRPAHMRQKPIFFRYEFLWSQLNSDRITQKDRVKYALPIGEKRKFYVLVFEGEKIPRHYVWAALSKIRSDVVKKREHLATQKNFLIDHILSHLCTNETDGSPMDNKWLSRS